MIFKRAVIMGTVILLCACASMQNNKPLPVFKALNNAGGARVIQKTIPVPIEKARGLTLPQFFISGMPCSLKKPGRTVKVNALAAPRQSSHTVYFRLGSSVITQAESLKLQKFVAQHKFLPVAVTGYTCWLGSRIFNQNLALKRAKAVAAFLKKSKMRVASITGKPKCCYVNLKNPRMDRRVEIQVLKGGDNFR